MIQDILIISFQVTGKNGQKLNVTVDIQQGKLFVVRPNKSTLDASNVFLHDKSKIFVLKHGIYYNYYIDEKMCHLIHLF